MLKWLVLKKSVQFLTIFWKSEFYLPSIFASSEATIYRLPSRSTCRIADAIRGAATSFCGNQPIDYFGDFVTVIRGCMFERPLKCRNYEACD